MRISVAEAEGQLAELVRRAHAGDEVVLIGEGGRDVRLVPDLSVKKYRDLGKIVAEVQASAAKQLLPGPDAARSQDFLYDEFGIPK